MNRTLSVDFLRTFVAIADAGTFAAAAERVGRTVSAVSLQIDRLEEQVGRALFQKFGRRMEPTSAGRQLLDHARTILAANDAALGYPARSVSASCTTGSRRPLRPCSPISWRRIRTRASKWWSTPARP